jgi:hypothetical protein
MTRTFSVHVSLGSQFKWTHKHNDAPEMILNKWVDKHCSNLKSDILWKDTITLGHAWKFVKNEYELQHTAHPSLCTEHTSHLTDIHEILHWGQLLKFVMNSQVCLILDKNIMHFTTRTKNFLCSSQLNNTRQNSLLHFHGNTFNTSVLFQCKIYSSNGQHMSAVTSI